MTYARWIAIAIACLLLAGFAGGAVENLAPYAGDEAPGSDSDRVDKLFQSALGADPLADVAVLGPAARRDAILHELHSEPEVASAQAIAFSEGGNRLVYVRALLRPGPAKRQQDAALRLSRELAGPQVQVGGTVLGYAQATRISGDDLRRAELIVAPILFLCLLIVFRSAVAALVPIVFAFLTIIGTLAILRALAELTTISVFALNLVAALGVGLSIDFSLLMISRFREEAARGDVSAARGAMMRTAGRTVAYSCLTIFVALSALIVFPAGLLRSLGIGGAIVTAVAGFFALALLPSLLGALGERIDALALPRSRLRLLRSVDPASGASAWARWSRWVVDHGLLGTVIALAALVVLAAPVIDLQVISAASTVNLPATATARQANERIESLQGVSTSPLLLAAEVDAAPRLRAELARTGIVRSVAEVRRRKYVFIEASLRSGPFSPASEALVSRLRDRDVLVGGRTAAFVDYREEIDNKLPWAIAIAVGVTSLLLFLLSRSFVIPLKSILANAFTIAAVFGVMVWALQQGHFSGLLDYRGSGALIDPTIPIFVAALAFGLSTDYGVFLLGRVLEGKASGLSDRDAVAEALARTGRVITSVALLFCIAVGAVMTSRIATIKEAGFGMVVAVAIDATIVRSLLVPALMSVLGKWNWWAPRRLARLGGVYSSRAMEVTGENRLSSQPGAR